jgi:hypothetical protein
MSKNEFHAFTIEPSEDGVAVYGHGVYGRGSVLEGADRRCYMAWFASAEEALAAYPQAEESGCTKSHFDPMPQCAPAWFDPADAGEAWGEEDY